MHVLVTGHDGYIGTVLVPMLKARGHRVMGYDSLLYRGCALLAEPAQLPGGARDIRDITAAELKGFDVVIHLAGVSNDPLGDLSPVATYDINLGGTRRVAEAAKAAGVTRFVFSSSCSIYGASANAPVDESAPFRPVTPYGESKMMAEQALLKMADEDFSPTFLRNATAYGASPRLRGDLVVNNLAGYAFTTGLVQLKSDGRSWRPLIHVEDIARAFVAAAEAPRETVHAQAWNVCAPGENYRVIEVAEMIERAVPDAVISFADGAEPDVRNYRVDCSRITAELPSYQPRWTVEDGIVEVLKMYDEAGLSVDDLTGGRSQRIQRVLALQGEGRLDADLRWIR